MPTPEQAKAMAAHVAQLLADGTNVCVMIDDDEVSLVGRDALQQLVQDEGTRAMLRIIPRKLLDAKRDLVRVHALVQDAIEKSPRWAVTYYVEGV